ncbi:DGQHR domain-containing protein [Methanorbis furvi]|uniref:DGQHR domain-containing protein n=1 Tax=Methanorbis furvi TaxID=3028299 RepID=A0AAE4MDZ8_9EURY|nr:hypothetical protein [Methanocorpusculaceae archaeon Ag1]
MKSIGDDFTLSGLSVGEELDKAAKIRARIWDKTKIISHTDLKKYEDEGWTKTKSSRKLKKGSVKIIKYKEPWKLFEDEIWSIFYKLGFSELNKESPSFKIPRYNTGITKQIDIFAREDNTIFVIECKSSLEQKSSSKDASIRRTISEIADMRQHINESIYMHYKNMGITDKFTVIWVLALKNISLSDADRILLNESGIKLIDTDLMQYYQRLADDFRSSAKYMFLGDFLQGKEIHGLIGAPVPAIKGEMGGQIFYSFLIEPEKLLKISYLAHRGKTNDETIKTYQRVAKRSRLNKIAKYIQEKPGGIFPTSIVINLDAESKSFKFEPFQGTKNENAIMGHLYLPNKYHSAWIIDGQHRLYAYSDLPEASTATLPVIAFVNLKPEYQTKLFVDINGEQKSVPKNQLLSLYATLNRESPYPKQRLQSMYSTIALMLNDQDTSVFYHRIDDGTSNGSKPITMNNITEVLSETKLIGSVPTSKAGQKNITYGPLYWENYEKTCDHVSKVICEYYRFMQSNGLQDQWDLEGRDGGFLNTNTGIRSTLKLLGYLIKELQRFEGNVSYREAKKLIQDLDKYLQPLISYLQTSSPAKLNDLRTRSGKGGISECVNEFIFIINKQIPSFYPEEAKKYAETQLTPNIELNAKTIEICSRLTDSAREYVVQSLEEKYGDDISEWWGKGVPNTIRQDVAKIAQKEGDYSQNYQKHMTLTHLHGIVLENWNLFENSFTVMSKITDKPETRVKWIKRLDSIQNKYQNSGKINEEDAKYVEDAFAEFQENISDGE